MHGFVVLAPMGQEAASHVSIHRFSYLLLASSILFWALAFPVIKIALRELSALNLTILRLFLACLIFLGIFALFRHRFSPLQRKDIIPIFVLGFTGIIMYHLGLNYAEQFISASAASLLIATIPIFVVILAVVFLKEKIGIFILLGILFCLSGVVIISVYGSAGQMIEISYIVGALAALMAAFVGAVYTIAGKKMLARYSGMSLTMYAFVFGTIGLVPLLRPLFFTQVFSLSMDGWSAVLFLSIGSSVIAYVAWFVVLEMKNTSEVSVYLYVIPVVSTIISFLFLDEQITWLFIVGGFFVIFGLYLVNRERKIAKIRPK